MDWYRSIVETKFTFKDLESSESQVLRVRPERGADERTVRRAMGFMWDAVKAAISSAGHWDDWDMRLGTTGPKGSFFVRKGRRIFELFKVKAKEGNRRPLAVISSCGDLTSWGLPPATCSEIIDAALAKANNQE